MIVLYGIKNCDTVKKARVWLEKAHIEYRFHDFRVDGLEAAQVKTWLDELGAETLINKRSTTWKELDAPARSQIEKGQAVAVLVAHPTLIKRPVLDTGHARSVGFSEAAYNALFRQHTL